MMKKILLALLFCRFGLASEISKESSQEIILKDFRFANYSILRKPSASQNQDVDVVSTSKQPKEEPISHLQVQLPDNRDIYETSYIREINNAFMNPGLYNHVNGYVLQLNNTALLYGYYATDRDAPFIPIGLSENQEIALRTEMANAIKSYTISKSFPDYIKSKLSRNSFFAYMLGVTSDVQNFKIFSQKESAAKQAREREKALIQQQSDNNSASTEAMTSTGDTAASKIPPPPPAVVVPPPPPAHPWEMKAGITPRTWKGLTPATWDSWGHLYNDQWSIHLGYGLEGTDTRLNVSRSFKQWDFLTGYHVQREDLSPGVNHYWPKRQTRVGFFVGIPLAAADVSYSTTYRLELAHVWQ